MIRKGKVHEYLGFELDFETDPGTLIVSMIKYLQKFLMRKVVKSFLRRWQDSSIVQCHSFCFFAKGHNQILKHWCHFSHDVIQ